MNVVPSSEGESLAREIVPDISQQSGPSSPNVLTQLADRALSYLWRASLRSKADAKNPKQQPGQPTRELETLDIGRIGTSNCAKVNHFISSHSSLSEAEAPSAPSSGVGYSRLLDTRWSFSQGAHEFTTCGASCVSRRMNFQSSSPLNPSLESQQFSPCSSSTTTPQQYFFRNSLPSSRIDGLKSCEDVGHPAPRRRGMHASIMSVYCSPGNRSSAALEKFLSSQKLSLGQMVASVPERGRVSGERSLHCANTPSSTHAPSSTYRRPVQIVSTSVQHDGVEPICQTNKGYPAFPSSSPPARVSHHGGRPPLDQNSYKNRILLSRRRGSTVSQTSQLSHVSYCSTASLRSPAAVFHGSGCEDAGARATSEKSDAEEGTKVPRESKTVISLRRHMEKLLPFQAEREARLSIPLTAAKVANLQGFQREKLRRVRDCSRVYLPRDALTQSQNGTWTGALDAVTEDQPLIVMFFSTAGWVYGADQLNWDTARMDEVSEKKVLKVGRSDNNSRRHSRQDRNSVSLSISESTALTAEIVASNEKQREGRPKAADPRGFSSLTEKKRVGIRRVPRDAAAATATASGGGGGDGDGGGGGAAELGVGIVAGQRYAAVVVGKDGVAAAAEGAGRNEQRREERMGAAALKGKTRPTGAGAGADSRVAAGKVNKHDGETSKSEFKEDSERTLGLT